MQIPRIQQTFITKTLLDTGWIVICDKFQSKVVHISGYLFGKCFIEKRQRNKRELLLCSRSIKTHLN